MKFQITFLHLLSRKIHNALERKKKFKRFMKHVILEDFLTDLDNKLSTYSIKLSDEKNVNQDVLKLRSIFKKL